MHPDIASRYCIQILHPDIASRYHCTLALLPDVQTGFKNNDSIETKHNGPRLPFKYNAVIETGNSSPKGLGSLRPTTITPDESGSLVHYDMNLWNSRWTNSKFSQLFLPKEKYWKGKWKIKINFKCRRKSYLKSSHLHCPLKRSEPHFEHCNLIFSAGEISFKTRGSGFRLTECLSFS